MRRYILWIVLSVIVCNLGAGVAYADGMILPEVLSPDYLVVRYHRVTVDVEDGHAVTRVAQEFYNPHPFPVRGRYLFPVPPEAMLSGFQATLDGQRQPVTRQDPETSNAALFDGVVQRRDPSLLQYAGWETLAFDVDLPAGGARQMTLEYEEALAPQGGLYRYRYVLSTERYSAQPLEQALVTVNLDLASGLSSLYSPSHAVDVTRLGPGRAQVTWAAQDVRPTEDFELFFAPEESGFGGGWLTGRREGQDHFLFLFAPEDAPARDDALPKDIVFVIDRSGSMGGNKIAQAHEALRYILGQLDAGDRFSIVGFDERLSVWSPTLRPVDGDTLAGARRFVDGLTAAGDTDLDAALQAGLEILNRAPGRDTAVERAIPLLVFLTDGLPTAGVTETPLILRQVREANAGSESRVHVFGVGYDVNTHLLDQLAAENGGSVTYVQRDESLETALTAFYSRIAHPVLTDVTVDFEGLEVSDLYPSQLPDLFRGSSLLLAGRYRATDARANERVTVRVRGRAGGETRQYVYHLDLPGADDAGRDFVPRLWATRRVGALLDRVRVEGERPALVDEIRALGLSYGLVTPYTTFAIAAQAEGAASTANMALYADTAGLNQAWGQTTVQARVQNQLYQGAEQANLAHGANVVQHSQGGLVQVANQQVDLALLRELDAPEGPVTAEWIARHIAVDRQVIFGSKDYFALAADPALRPYLQAGTNLIFAHAGQVIAVQDPEATTPDPEPVPDLSLPSSVPALEPLNSSNPSNPSNPPAPRPATWLAHLLALLISWR